ncbi:hypothetical protein BSL78_18235 [Apostichopus japonicus]|uniref:Transmembrane protein n=1 Tax=Stichopus japonicus TaxID=307972 RepID=A0A2G8KA81_STIJA|nr:hypothetical protein BSL78_18235 [Apostichopus japonicus]
MMFISLFVLTEQGNTNDLPPYNAAPAAYYPPPGQGVNPPAMNYGAPPVVIQQPPAGVEEMVPTLADIIISFRRHQTVVVTDMNAMNQPRPSHGLAIGTLIFAIVTFVVTFPSSALCTIPAMIMSGVALARDYEVEEAKKLSMVSLVLTVIFWVCAVVFVVVIIVVAVSAKNEYSDFTSHNFDYSSHNSDDLWLQK